MDTGELLMGIRLAAADGRMAPWPAVRGAWYQHTRPGGTLVGFVEQVNRLRVQGLVRVVLADETGDTEAEDPRETWVELTDAGLVELDRWLESNP